MGKALEKETILEEEASLRGLQPGFEKKERSDDVVTEVANNKHLSYAAQISQLIEQASLEPNTGLAKRSQEYIEDKIRQGKSIIALGKNGELAGFCYLETWGHGKYLANSGLTVAPAFRRQGLAKKIKEKAFQLSREKYPAAKLFGLTTNPAVMKINSNLGYRPVTFCALTDDKEFWAGCESCTFYDILQRTNRKICLCTGMLCDPNEKK